MTQEALKKMYQLLLTEPHAPTVCAQLEEIAREALSQPEPKPIALMQEADVRMMADVHGINPSTRGLYGFYIDCVSTSPQPPQRTWVDLTEPERNDIEDYCEMIIGKAAFDAIEAKLQEKNT